MTGPTPRDQIEQAFALALETPPERRDALLRELLPDDGARALVYRLLRSHESVESTGDGFLETLDPVAAGLLLEAANVPPAFIGRYRVERPLARGGHGLVYLAHDPDLDRPVAIKVLPQARVQSEAARERLRAEARVVSALDHPHIATIHEIGRSESGELFVVMAYYQGATLRERLAAGPLPVPEVRRIGTQLASALAAAHAAGIVHRDVKPENVILTTGGVRLVDFGIAATIGPGEPSAAAAGTVAYMSPEQSLGAPADPRADLWAVGVVLYEALAGHRPFSADRSDALLEAVRRANPVPLRKLRSDVPERLATLVHACLAREPERRPADAGVIQQALAPSPVSRRGIFAAAAVLVAAAGLIGTLVGRRPPVAPPGGTTDAIAESLYVRAMSLLEQNSPQNREEAGLLLRTAIERDSMFARAYAGLARVMARAPAARPGDRYARTQPLLQRAAALDSSNANVLLELGWMAMWYDRDWPAAERYLRRALALDPTDPWKYHYYAAWLSAIGRIEQAVEVETRAMAVDPRGAATVTHMALHLTRQHRYDEAIQMLEEVLARDTSWVRAHVVLGRAYLATGQHEKAIEQLRHDNYEFAGFDPTAILAYGLGVAGQRVEARRITAEFETAAKSGYTAPMNLIACYLGLGDHDRALDWVERVPDDRGALFFPRSEPMLEPLMQLPRYQAVLARLGLDSASVAGLPDTREALAAILDREGPRQEKLDGQGS
jgi:tetratricopeptide (TPR) repeat protein/predicted Ser/Thr protein kinase